LKDLASPPKWGMIIILYILSYQISSGSELRKPSNRYIDRTRGIRYAAVSGGVGIWYKSLQKGLDNRYIPYSAFIECGRIAYPFSIIAGTTFNTNFNYDRFLLNPNCYFAGIQYAPRKNSLPPKKFNIYAITGVNVNKSRFTEEAYPGIVIYENKVEEKYSIGVMAGVGLGYKIKSWEIKPMLLCFTGHSGFLAGHFTEQRFNTGSLQFHLSLNYQILFNRNTRTCPVYHNFLRL
jgi:hypothetical protein